MSPVLVAAIMKSAGIGIGTTLGALVGLGLRKRNGKSEGLLADSVVLTALLAGVLALAVSVALRLMGLV